MSLSTSHLLPVVEDNIDSDMDMDMDLSPLPLPLPSRRTSPSAVPRDMQHMSTQQHTQPQQQQQQRAASKHHAHDSDAEQTVPAPVAVRAISVPVLTANATAAATNKVQLQSRASVRFVAPCHPPPPPPPYPPHVQQKSWTAPPSLFAMSSTSTPAHNHTQYYPHVHRQHVMSGAFHDYHSSRVTVSSRSRSFVLWWAIMVCTLLLVVILWHLPSLFGHSSGLPPSTASNDLDRVQSHFQTLHMINAGRQLAQDGPKPQHVTTSYQNMYNNAESHRRVLAQMKKDMQQEQQQQQIQNQQLQQQQYQQLQQQWRQQQQQAEQQRIAKLQQQQQQQQPQQSYSRYSQQTQNHYQRYGNKQTQKYYGSEFETPTFDPSKPYVRSSSIPQIDTVWSTVSEDAGTPESIARDMKGPPIDVVYTWVNGSDPVWQAKQRQHGEREEIANKYREWNEIRYSMRSVAMYAPWVRNIILVTDDQTPSWLNTSDPRIRIVHHRDLFPNPEQELPTFNSFAIELVIHRIPGLSDDFIYMNNDFFIGRPLSRAQFGNATHYYRYVDYGVQLKSWCWRAIWTDSQSEETLTRSVDACSEELFYWNQMLSYYYFGTRIQYWFAHMPHLHNRLILADVERRLEKWFTAARMNRWRNPATDLSVHLQYESALTQLAWSRKTPPQSIYSYANQPRYNSYGQAAYGGQNNYNDPYNQRKQSNKKWSWFGISGDLDSTKPPMNDPNRLPTKSLRPELEVVEDVIVSDLSDYDHHHLYQYYVFMNHDTHESYYDKLNHRYAYYQPLFFAIDDDLKYPTPAIVDFHRKHLTNFMQTHWPTVPSWELPSSLDI